MKLSKILSISLVALMLLSVIPAYTFANDLEEPHDANAMWLEQSNINFSTAEHTVGYKFNVTVYVNISTLTTGATEVGTWEYELSYNKNYLNLTRRTWLGDYFEGLSTLETGPSFGSLDATYDYILHAQAILFEPYKAVPSYGSCAIVEFVVLAAPDKGETITDTLDISSHTETYVQDDLGGYVPLTIYDASYTYYWAAPGLPHMAISPAAGSNPGDPRYYDQYSNWTGTQFTENVLIADLDVAWHLTNVTCTVNFNPSFLEVLSVAFDSAWDVATTSTIDNVIGTVDLYAETSGTLSGDVLVATLTFNITDQGLYPTVYVSDLTFTGVELWDHTLEISTEAPVEGVVTVVGYQAIPLPWLQVEPDYQEFGPENVIGQTFTVSVDMKRLHPGWAFVGLNFRLHYCDDMFKVVKIEEGDYLSGYADYGIWFYGGDETAFEHVLVGAMIIPNGTGHWYPPMTPPGAFPGEAGENGTIAIITFQIIKQLVAFPPEPLCCNLIFLEDGTMMLDQLGNHIPFEPEVGGEVCVLSSPEVGRVIDVYGGADNAGYGSCPFPAPYGGQGLNQPMDLVIPQSEVCLYADVSYNYWPVQQKVVSFEVEGPYFHLYNETSGEWYYKAKDSWMLLLKGTARSDENGVAYISFAMPWKCENPEYYLGVYKVTATVNIRDIIVIDTLYYYYDYLVHIWKVTTEKVNYGHCEDVDITIEYGTHSMQYYDAILATMIKDNLNVPIAIDTIDKTIGGAEFCTFNNDTAIITLHIEKWAFVGYADIYVNFYDKDPTEGGFALCPQYLAEDIIYIQPV